MHRGQKATEGPFAASAELSISTRRSLTSGLFSGFLIDRVPSQHTSNSWRLPRTVQCEVTTFLGQESCPGTHSPRLLHTLSSANLLLLSRLSSPPPFPSLSAPLFTFTFAPLPFRLSPFSFLVFAWLFLSHLPASTLISLSPFLPATLSRPSSANSHSLACHFHSILNHSTTSSINLQKIPSL